MHLATNRAREKVAWSAQPDADTRARLAEIRAKLRGRLGSCLILDSAISPTTDERLFSLLEWANPRDVINCTHPKSE
jgi:hypothetical protein